MLTATIAYRTKKKSIFDNILAPMFSILNMIVQFWIFVVLHFARFTHSGRVCSGDFLAAEDRKRMFEI